MFIRILIGPTSGGSVKSDDPICRRISINGGHSVLPCASWSRVLALAPFLVLISCANIFAHCFVGPRFLPATLATDDPCVADQISLPTVAWSRRMTFHP
jgi:hypothetical protein